METLLMIAVIVTALAIVAQAGVLVAMYLMASRISKNAESLMEANRRLLVPLEPVVHNVKVVSNDLTEISSTARAQAERVATLVHEGTDAIRSQAADVKSTVMSPVRYAGAVIAGIAEGWRVLRRGGTHGHDENDLGRYRAS
jgi:hypothetical protein